MDCFSDKTNKDATPVHLVREADWPTWSAGQPERVGTWAATNQFSAKPGTVCVIPDEDGRIDSVFLGHDAEDQNSLGLDIYSGLYASLPTGDYTLTAELSAQAATQAALGWALGGYRFETYLKQPKDAPKPRLVAPNGCDQGYVVAAAQATFLVRDLVNTPANDMGPQELCDAANTVAGQFGAELRVVIGEGLVENNFPAIHTVGMGSEREPRLIDFSWGDANAPKVTLVGKGVCFDTGGYDLKPSQHMALMKKDMGGAAHVLGLAHMIMATELPVRLRVLIPAVENSISGRAFRPSDVIGTRSGLSVEVGNTDAEGRLVLADALVLAGEEDPDLLIDYATLTGAARAALGPDLAAMFTGDDGLADDLNTLSQSEFDPLWRLPLWEPYTKNLESSIADLNNDGGSFAGAINAALFLKKFVSKPERWIHFDVYAWNPKAASGRPKGGEAMAMRAVHRLLERRFTA